MKRPPTGNIKSKLPENKWEFLKKMLMKCFHWTPKQVPIIHVNSEWRWKVWNFLQLGRWEGAVTKQAWCFVLVWFGFFFFFFKKYMNTPKTQNPSSRKADNSASTIGVYCVSIFTSHFHPEMWLHFKTSVKAQQPPKNTQPSNVENAVWWRSFLAHENLKWEVERANVWPLKPSFSSQ